MTILRSVYSKQLLVYQKDLLSLVADKVSDPDVVYDIVQDVLVQGYDKLEQLKEDHKISKWLETIAIRKIHDHLKNNNKHRWTTALKRYADASVSARPSLMEDLTEVAQRLSRLKLDTDAAIAVTLQVLMGWKPKDFLNQIGLQPKKYYSWIAKAKKQMAKGQRESDPQKEIAIKVWTINALWNHAMSPLPGNGFRNSNLCREVFSLMSMIAHQHPEDPFVISNMAIKCFQFSSSKQYPTDLSPPLSVRQWKRNLWDHELQEKGVSLTNKAHTLPLDSLQRLHLGNAFHIYTANSHQDVDAAAVISRLNEALKHYNNSTYYYQIVDWTAELKSPLQAANYLEQVKKNSVLVGNAKTYFQLAELYFAAGKWKKARSNYNKYLKWPCSEVMSDWIKAKRQACIQEGQHPH